MVKVTDRKKSSNNRIQNIPAFGHSESQFLHLLQPPECELLKGAKSFALRGSVRSDSRKMFRYDGKSLGKIKSEKEHF